MKKLVPITVATILCATTFSQQQSEAVVNGTVKTVTRLVSITPTFTDDSNVNLLSLTETFKQFSILPDNSVVNMVTFSRQWTWESITNMSMLWTNSNNVVFTNNVYRTQLELLWTRFNLQPERATLTFTQPNILTTQ